MSTWPERRAIYINTVEHLRNPWTSITDTLDRILIRELFPIDQDKHDWEQCLEQCIQAWDQFIGVVAFIKTEYERTKKLYEEPAAQRLGAIVDDLIFICQSLRYMGRRDYTFTARLMSMKNILFSAVSELRAAGHEATKQTHIAQD